MTRTTVHAAGFAKAHGSSAASGRLDCMGCHTQTQCTDCHAGSARRRFHAVDYMSRHAADAYGDRTSCTTCHSAETFCRSCHIGNGVASRGGTAGGSGTAHNRQPLWLLQRGQAARQGLEGCVTCHQQRDCLRCHSDLGQRVNPHGADFDASRVAARNRQVCAVCHLADPTRSR
jgi:hypothetical protein